MSILTDAQPTLDKLEKQVLTNRVTIISNMITKANRIRQRWDLIVATLRAIQKLPPKIIGFDRDNRGNSVIVIHTDIPAPKDDGHESFRDYRIQINDQVTTIEEHAGALFCIESVTFDRVALDDIVNSAMELKADWSKVDLWRIVHLSEKLTKLQNTVERFEDMLGPVEDAIANAIKTVSSTVEDLCAIPPEQMTK